MSYFGNQLEALLEKKNMKAVRLAEISGVSQSTVSRYITGDQKSVSVEDLEAICGALSQDPNEQAVLIRAHLLDECHGPGAKLIQINIADENAKLEDASPQYHHSLPGELEQHMARIREWVAKDTHLREVIEGLGSFLAETESAPPNKAHRSKTQSGNTDSHQR